MEKIVLGIETSCDDTSMAVIKGNPSDLLTPPKVLAKKIFSQDDFLREWGGVVPEIAARNHMEKLIPLYKEVMELANIKIKKIDLVGVTTLPGLLGPLLTGLGLAKTISLFHKTPIFPVNHLFAHLEAIHLTNRIPYPYLGLLVSGGHGIFFHVKNRDQFEIIGSTIDDAPGEAFDKGGRILGLGYPAGRLIDERAKKGNPLRYSFPIGLKDEKTPRMSFSGVKTSLRYFLEENPNLLKSENDFNDLIASYQHAIVMALNLKLKRAIGIAGAIPIVVGGGVAANSYLRKTLVNNFEQVHFVAPEFCTDNGTMIANFAFRHFDHQIQYPESLELDAKSRYLEKSALQKKGDTK